MALHVEALAEAGRDSEALAAADRFRDRYPSSGRLHEVRWIEATVARDRQKDCERALPVYRELARHTGPRQSEALYYQGICAHELGLDEEAADALRQAQELGLDPDQEAAARSIREAGP